jgi:hypothetical protein
MSTTRHAVSFIEAGPQQGPLMIFVHGWPELGILWRRQLEYFAGLGWHCVAPARTPGMSTMPPTSPTPDKLPIGDGCHSRSCS